MIVEYDNDFFDEGFNTGVEIEIHCYLMNSEEMV